MRQPIIADLKLALADAEIEKRLLREQVAELERAHAVLSQQLAASSEAPDQEEPPA